MTKSRRRRKKSRKERGTRRKIKRRRDDDDEGLYELWTEVNNTTLPIFKEGMKRIGMAFSHPYHHIKRVTNLFVLFI